MYIKLLTETLNFALVGLISFSERGLRYGDFSVYPGGSLCPIHIALSLVYESTSGMRILSIVGIASFPVSMSEDQLILTNLQETLLVLSWLVEIWVCICDLYHIPDLTWHKLLKFAQLEDTYLFVSQINLLAGDELPNQDKEKQT